jgi:hypothetical protein
VAHKELIVALGILVAASPVSASQDPAPTTGAPAASASAQYCLRVEPVTGTRIETILCLTRAEWVELEVDLDKEWAEEGVAVREPGQG